MKARMNRQQLAQCVAQDIPEGSYVNLGIGIPSLVADYVDREVVFQTENGVLGVGPKPSPDEADWELINAMKEPVTLVKGGAFFSHVDAFGMIRGRHLDIAILGAYQVSARGDLANWNLGGGEVPVVGGAMDLAVGARNVYVAMEHTTKDGTPKIVEQCTYALTARRVVTRIYTDVCVLDVSDQGHLLVRKLLEGWSLEEVQQITGAKLAMGDNVASLTLA